MKFLLGLAFLALFTVSASAKDTLKLNFAQTRDLIDALSKLDGATQVVDGPADKDGKPTKVTAQVGYEFKGKTRLAIARDIKALQDSVKSYQDSWQAYLKGHGIVDESKETPEQQKAVVDLLNTPSEVSLYLFDEEELSPKDSTVNAIPPSILTRLLPLIKS